MRLKITRLTSAIRPKIRKRYMCLFTGSGMHIRTDKQERIYNWNDHQFITSSKNYGNGFVNTEWTGSNVNVMVSASTERSGTLKFFLLDAGAYGDLYGVAEPGLKFTFNQTGSSDYGYLSGSFYNQISGSTKHTFMAHFISQGNYTSSNLMTTMSNGTSDVYESFNYINSIITASNTTGSAKWFTNKIDTNSGYASEYRIKFNMNLVSGSYPTMSLVNNVTSETVRNSSTFLAKTGSNDHILKLNTTSTTDVYVRFMNTSYSEYYISSLDISKITNPIITVKIGEASASKQISSLFTSAWDKFVLNFTSSATSPNKDIQIYSNIPDSIFMNRPVLTKSYDYAISIKFKQFPNTTTQALSSRSEGGINPGWYIYFAGSTRTITFYMADYYSSISVPTPASAYQFDTWNVLNCVLNKTGNAMIYLNGNLVASASAENLGLTYGYYLPALGGLTYSLWFNGYISDFQVAKFDDINASNFNPARYVTNFYTPTGGNSDSFYTMEFNKQNPPAILLDNKYNMLLSYYSIDINNIYDLN